MLFLPPCLSSKYLVELRAIIEQFFSALCEYVHTYLLLRTISEKSRRIYQFSLSFTFSLILPHRIEGGRMPVACYPYLRK